MKASSRHDDVLVNVELHGSDLVEKRNTWSLLQIAKEDAFCSRDLLSIVLVPDTITDRLVALMTCSTTLSGRVGPPSVLELK